MKIFGQTGLLILCLVSAMAAGCRNQPPRLAIHPASGGPVVAGKTNPITDLVLIYNGAQPGAVWTAERFKPYVYRDVGGKFEWLFDGFLFLDLLAPSGARTCPITHRPDAVKRDWEDMLDNYFREGQSLAALEQLLTQLEAAGHIPIRKRQIVLMLPTPIVGSFPQEIVVKAEWGNVNGRQLDFHRDADRQEAAQWYVDEAIRRWEQKHYRHLQLAGFYWMFERSWGVHHTKQVGEYVKARGGYFYWIPSWPQGRSNWKTLGFDFVYQQPNYFFHRKPTPSTRLEESCQFAEGCHTTMEMEFNKDLLTKPPFLRYFDEYLEAYSRHDVWKRKPVAYYEGEGAWGEMARSNDPAVRSRFAALGDIIVERQNRADNGFIFDQR